MADKVIPVRMPDATFDLMESIRKQRNARMKGEPLSRSAWIREAIREKIAHATRSRKGNTQKLYTCENCKLPKPIGEIAHSLTTLTGNKQHFCKQCVEYRKVNIQPPLLDHGTGSLESPADMG